MADQRFDEYAREYDETVQRAIGASGETVQYFADLKAQLMRRTLGAERPQKILDFGCGIGNASRALSRVFPDAAITGTDVSAESIATAQRMGGAETSRIRYALASSSELPLDDASVDAAFTSCVFHHIDRAERVRWAKELWRVLRPGAPLFLFEHNPFNPLTRRVVARIPFDEGVELLTAREAAQLLRAAGYSVSSPHYYFFFPRQLGFMRPLEQFLQRLPIGAQYFVIGRRAPM